MRIIGLTGRARSGKDTLGTFLQEDHDYYRIALADPLRTVVSEITGIPFKDLLDGPTKEQPIDWLGGKSPRQMMQTLGTEWGRECVYRDIWLRVAEREIDVARRTGHTGVVITDIRFDNEAAWVRGMGGEVVVVQRRSTATVSNHTSEDGVSPRLLDRIVFNHYDLSHLASEARRLVAMPCFQAA